MVPRARTRNRVVSGEAAVGRPDRRPARTRHHAAREQPPSMVQMHHAPWDLTGGQRHLGRTDVDRPAEVGAR